MASSSGDAADQRCCRPRARPGVILALLLLAASIGPCGGKRQVSSVRLGGKRFGVQHRWSYMAKFGYATGEGSYKARVRLMGRAGDPLRPTENVSIGFECYLDETWPQVVGMEDNPCQRRTLAKKARVFNMTPDGEWSDWSGGSVKQKIRAHVWYYALADCENDSPLLPSDRGQWIEFEIQFLQEGGSHFGVDQRWTLPSNVVSLLCFVGFVMTFGSRLRHEAVSTGKVHFVVWTLGAVVVLQLAAQALHALHLFKYSYNGSGIRAVEIFAEVLFMLSELGLSTLLIVIGFGYTLLPVKMQPEVVLPLLVLGFFVHLSLIAVSKNEDGAADKFHSHDGVPGQILIALRLALFALFLWAVHSTSHDQGWRLQNFLARFRICGSLYFVGYPILFLVVQPVAPYWRPPILTACFLLIQIVTNLWLYSLFLSRGEYFKVSELGDTPLPGGTPRKHINGGINKHQ
eukprot:TRINITY_DN60008_c0_g1_i1.p1 TRINITY_DN60008_c0_g1~~TRINITY_DN60008_c0_g1_i1.p1  ORF type:complete len:469 (+),score=73.90 TRINITY_DN60008_c0_g1_i1:28-1407(+)